MEVQQIIDASDLVKGTIFHLNILHIYYVVLFSVTSHLFWYPYAGVQGRCTFMESDIATLSMGCQFWKVRSDRGWYLRRFWLDIEHLCLRYVPSQKPFWNTSPTRGTFVHYFRLPEKF